MSDKLAYMLYDLAGVLDEWIKALQDLMQFAWEQSGETLTNL